MQLQDKIAIVLGASAERGTGWAVAERFAAEGAKVLVGARREAPLRALAKRIGGAAQACDVAVENDVIALAAQALKLYGRLDIAVNAAGLPAGGKIANVSHSEV